jgi:hypothetical protein
MLNYLDSRYGRLFLCIYCPCIYVSMALDDGDFFFCQAIASIDDEADQPISGGNLALQR